MAGTVKNDLLSDKLIDYKSVKYNLYFCILLSFFRKCKSDLLSVIHSAYLFLLNKKKQLLCVTEIKSYVHCRGVHRLLLPT
jgi:hypothetical protein